MKLSPREMAGLAVGILGIAGLSIGMDAVLSGRGAWYADVVLMAGLPMVVIGGAIGNSRLVGGVLMGGGFLFGGVALLVKALGLAAGAREACLIMGSIFIPLGIVFGYVLVVRRDEKAGGHRRKRAG